MGLAARCRISVGPTTYYGQVLRLEVRPEPDAVFKPESEREWP